MSVPNGVKSYYIRQIKGKTGHAIIQIDKSAQNCILLYGGANECLTEEYVDEVLEGFEAGDMLLLQNEVNMIPYIVDKAYEKGMQIALNPSPFNDRLKDVDMSVFGFIDESEFYGEDFTLDDSDKSEFVTMTLTLHEKQADAIKAAMDAVGEPRETFGNTNSHGNAIYEVVMEWAEQRT